MESLAVLGGPLWFRLGDRDLGTHLERTRLLRAGLSLSEVTARFCDAWGIAHQVVPMSDQTVPTLVQTEEGELPFQEYFVLHRCRPRVNGFCFSGVEQAKPARGVPNLQNVN
jgi:LPPG:FO 2-phospho-L-lactate transferase